MNKDFRISWSDDAVVFTIDRPAKLNALTKAVLDGLAVCLDEAEARGTRLLVLTGDGERAFCAGTDLAELLEMPVPARLAKNDLARDLFVRLSRSPVVSVAAINGLALGGGLEIAMACTLRIAAAHASFGLPEVKLSLLPAYAGTAFLMALVGRGRAEELLLTGRTIDLAEALAIGLIHRAAAGGEDLVAAATAFGREVTAHDGAAVAAIRDCVAAAGRAALDAGLAMEAERVQTLFASSDAENGIARFLKRRS